MKKAGEIINHLNETRANIYELSKQFGLGDTTLRRRLIKLGYALNQRGEWEYTGDPDKEPVDEDVVTKKRMATPKNPLVTHQVNTGGNITIHQALMELDLTNKGVRTTIKIQPEYIEEMKELAAKTRLRLSDLYTLAVYELLEKYRSN
jgi:hypothetical protein